LQSERKETTPEKNGRTPLLPIQFFGIKKGRVKPPVGKSKGSFERKSQG